MTIRSAVSAREGCGKLTTAWAGRAQPRRSDPCHAPSETSSSGSRPCLAARSPSTRGTAFSASCCRFDGDQKLAERAQRQRDARPRSGLLHADLLPRGRGGTDNGEPGPDRLGRAPDDRRSPDRPVACADRGRAAPTFVAAPCGSGNAACSRASKIGATSRQCGGQPCPRAGRGTTWRSPMRPAPIRMAFAGGASLSRRRSPSVVSAQREPS